MICVIMKAKIQKRKEKGIIVILAYVTVIGETPDPFRPRTLTDKCCCWRSASHVRHDCSLCISLSPPCTRG